MEEKIKLTELTKDELRRVTGGKMGGNDECDCSGNKQKFGQHDSEGKPISKPITKPK